MRPRAVGVGLALACLVGARSPVVADQSLLDAIRAADVRAVGALLKAGANPNAPDDIGATPLMYAAAFSSADILRALLDRRADPNTTSHGGATALMWATDAAKAVLLVDHGAALNVRLADGTSALVAAARRGDLETMRLLLARGATPKEDPGETTELLRIAYGDHPDIRAVVTGAGIEFSSLRATNVPSLATFRLSDAAAIGSLLDMGANPNPRARFPLLGAAAFQGYSATVRRLVERGANPNVKGQHDVTPLMMAAAAPRPDPGVVQLLMAKGASLDAHDQGGHTALDWALTRGEPAVVQVLRDAGVRSTEPPRPPAPIARPRAAREAVEAGVGRLRSISPVLYEQRKCIACHHQVLPLIAMQRARTSRINVDAKDLGHPGRAIVETWNGRREDLMVGREVAGGANELSYGLFALAEAGIAPSAATDAAIANLIATQRGDGSWVFLDTRPPQADNGPIPFTAMAIRGLEAYRPPGLRDLVKARIDRARGYLRTVSPSSTQDEAFKLLSLIWSRSAAGEVAGQAKRLVALQRESGGWAQTQTMSPDAYATGEALYALRVSGVSAGSPEYKRGVTYLLRTQLDDGTWFVRSRAFGFQPYFESGFPHGSDQFISASATAWAVIALSSVL